MTNWREYNEALRLRGSITFWFSQDAIDNWTLPASDKRGRQKYYSDICIETVLIIKKIYSLPLRQTQGFITSLMALMNLSTLPVPDFSTLSRRNETIELDKLVKAITPGSHVLVDSTGLKVYGKDEWHTLKHKANQKKTWRKLHLAVDEHHQIIACDLTTNKVDDETAVPNLLKQICHEFKTFIGDGAYDGTPTSNLIKEKQSDVEIIIPPPKNAAISKAGNTARDQHIRTIKTHGYINWQKSTSYGLRNYAELAMQRYKTMFGNKLSARRLERQKTEALICTHALNKMTGLGMARLLLLEHFE